MSACLSLSIPLQLGRKRGQGRQQGTAVQLKSVPGLANLQPQPTQVEPQPALAVRLPALLPTPVVQQALSMPQPLQQPTGEAFQPALPTAQVTLCPALSVGSLAAANRLASPLSARAEQEPEGSASQPSMPPRQLQSYMQEAQVHVVASGNTVSVGVGGLEHATDAAMCVATCLQHFISETRLLPEQARVTCHLHSLSSASSNVMPHL